MRTYVKSKKNRAPIKKCHAARTSLEWPRRRLPRPSNSYLFSGIGARMRIACGFLRGDFYVVFLRLKSYCTAISVWCVDCTTSVRIHRCRLFGIKSAQNGLKHTSQCSDRTGAGTHARCACAFKLIEDQCKVVSAGRSPNHINGAR
jgi:hypothetical protein